MGNVIKKMQDHAPKTFFGLYIFLAAYMTVFPLDNCPAIQAILFFSFWTVRHVKFFLKISTIIQVSALFFVTNNSGIFVFTNIINR